MIKRILAFSPLLVLAGIIGMTHLNCSSLKRVPKADQHNSRTALDWAGNYQGVLPCADCEGMATILVLQPDNSYRLQQFHIDGKANPEEHKGYFNWKSGGNSIELAGTPGKPRIRVGENQLFWIARKSPPKKQIADNSPYILRKTDLAVIEKYWKLKELNGVPVRTQGDRETHLILKHDGQVKGHGGCNALGGRYLLPEQNGLRFYNLTTTAKACPAIETETGFLEMLHSTNGYRLNGDTLWLYPDRDRLKAIARLEAVYLY